MQSSTQRGESSDRVWAAAWGSTAVKLPSSSETQVRHLGYIDLHRFFCFRYWTGIYRSHTDSLLLQMRCYSVSFGRNVRMRLQTVTQKSEQIFAGDPFWARRPEPKVSPYPPPIKDTSVLHDIFLLLSEHFTMFLLSEPRQDIWQ